MLSGVPMVLFWQRGSKTAESLLETERPDWPPKVQDLALPGLPSETPFKKKRPVFINRSSNINFLQNHSRKELLLQVLPEPIREVGLDGYKQSWKVQFQHYGTK